jgi:uncharacterized protein (TIGR03000 family)
MKNHDPTTGSRWPKRVGAALVLLGLAGIGLQEGQAQMYFSGGFVQVYRHPNKDVLSLAELGNASSAKTASGYPATISPDNDFRYRSHSTGSESSGPASPDGGPRYGSSAAILPWNQAGFKEYDESPVRIPDSPPLSAAEKYSLEVTSLPQAPAAGATERATLIVHLPERAMLWVDGRRSALQEPTSYFQSPVLTPSEKYYYTARVAWSEAGRRVSQVRKVLVEAGLVQAIYLRPATPMRTKPEMRVEAR